MKLDHLRIENCQRIKLFELSPDRNLIIIGGNNAQGKTSVLESVKMLLGGKRAQVSEPVHHGAEEAVITMTTDTGLIIEKHILPNGKERLTLQGPREGDGQSFLNSLYNKNTIDPLAFSLLDKKDQRQTLLGLVGINPATIDREIKDLMGKRTFVNRDLDQADAQLAAITCHLGVASEEVSIKEITDALSTASFTAQSEALKQQKLEQLKKEKATLKKRLEEIDTEGKALHEQLQSMQVPDLEELKTKLAELEDYNQKARANKTHEEVGARRKAICTESNTLTRAIEKLREDKITLLQSANFPVDGLSFDDEQVLYNGVPFEQASGAERLRVSTAIGIALQPELKLLLIKDGSLLDEHNLQMLNDMAEKRDVQILLERVGKDDKATIIVEDGEVEEDRTEG